MTIFLLRSRVRISEMDNYSTAWRRVRIPEMDDYSTAWRRVRIPEMDDQLQCTEA
jgi:hypothetical protein